MRTLFIGSTRRGFLTLQAMVEAGMDVVGVLSLAQHAHEKERFEDAIREFCRARGIAVRDTRLAREADLPSWARSLAAEAAFAVGVRVMLAESLYAVFPKGCWAVHDSLLPKYRGFAPLNWAIINGEPVTGVTLFQVAAGMDEGDILLQEEVTIGARETAPELYEKICAATSGLVVRGAALLEQGAPELRRQDEREASYACSRRPSDGLIDWARSTREIFDVIRALTFPYPGAFTFHDGAVLYVLAAEMIADPPRYVGRIPGKVVRVLDDGAVDVLTGDGVLRVLAVSTDGETVRKPAELSRARSFWGIDPLDLMTRLTHVPLVSREPAGS